MQIRWSAHSVIVNATVTQYTSSSQRRLTADWLAPRKSDCSRMRSKVTSDWLPSTSRPRDGFSRNSKWLNTFQTASYIYLLRSVSLVFFHISLYAGTRTRLRNVCLYQSLRWLTILEDFSASVYCENLKYYVTWSLLLKCKHVSVLPDTYCFCCHV